jgi:hypothetical protein
MALDYGHQPARRLTGPRPSLMIGGVALAVLGMGAIIAVWAGDRAAGVAKARQWLVEGQACPTLTPAALATQSEQPNKRFSFYEGQFARASGAASCDLVKDHGGRGLNIMQVCKFSSPDMLEIKTPKADVIYGPGLFQPVVVSLPGDQPHCVLIPHDRIQDMMSDLS